MKEQKTETVLICRPPKIINTVHQELLKRIIEMFKTFKYNIIFSPLEGQGDNINQIKRQFKRADIIIALPGGLEIVEDLLICIHENKKLEKPKDIILLNFAHYHQRLIDMITYYTSNDYKNESIFEFLYTFKSEDEIRFLLESKESKKLIFNPNMIQ